MKRKLHILLTSALLFGGSGSASASDCTEKVTKLSLSWPLEGQMVDYEIFLGFGAPWKNDEGHYWGAQDSVHLGIDVKLKLEDSDNRSDGDTRDLPTLVTKYKKVYAAYAGTACPYSPGGDWGGGVYIQHQASAEDREFTFYTIYTHIDVRAEIQGECIWVDQREPIGVPRSTSEVGSVFDLPNPVVKDRDHLHFAVRCDDIGIGKKCGGGDASELISRGGKCMNAAKFFPGLSRLFSDLWKDSWYYDYVDSLVMKGAIGGYPDWTFLPDGEINRVEFLKILLESLKISEYGDGVEFDPPTENPFPDVNVTDWFSGYVAYAKDNGIVEGLSDGTFGPSLSVARSEAVKMTINTVPALKEYYESEYLPKEQACRGEPQVCVSVDKEFPDVKNPNVLDPDGWYYYYVYAARDKDVIGGYPEGDFRPLDLLSRAEAAKIIACSMFDEDHKCN